jgi:putative endonuclease
MLAAPASLREALRARVRTHYIARVFYTYVLKCSDGKLYVGFAADLRKRVAQHKTGKVRATAHRRPVTLEYYEACGSELSARLREKQLKTGFGRAYLKRRLQT